ncbi:Xaa-Pro aminopeptidase [Acidihalobacter yilgarnensis]|uniref:Xaa-Pro aminopeptidase n=2 Tax=Acidihalobacter yilgarnensis TaxID=2819280 RepID=A0A1D8IKA9_9GAMM|nr:Xaa-Pro aminopeptidase [Acidihalobacter yilgarnensis]AOU96903.1 Xaa-Pro aminopeptidase [Acidihalobacter yilgarnensis]
MTLPTSEFARRRRQLMRQIGERGIVIMPAAPVRLRNRDADYRYRQDSDFLYLTGFSEPEAVAVLIPGRPQGEFILFCRERDLAQETWHGRRAGQAGAVERYGADDSFPITDIDDILPGLLEDRDRVFYSMGRDAAFDRQLMEWINRLRAQSRSGRQSPHEFVSLEYLLHEMRLFKSAAELKLMRRAAEIAIEGHRRMMAVCSPGLYEYEIEAEFIYTARRHRAELAYQSIVGGGENGCILHYVDNDAPLRDGELLLIDAGAEYAGYASDITRTFPVNGRFTPAQRELYELVLDAQHAAIKKTRPGNHWNDPHTAAVRVLTRGLVELGLLKGQPAKLIREGAYQRFYMHRTGHWLGLDVHDVGEYKIDGEWRLLEPGMVLTVEPGLYINPARDVPKRFHNIGIRIEDDVRVTAKGCEVLTVDMPKAVDEIEALVGSLVADPGATSVRRRA